MHVDRDDGHQPLAQPEIPAWVKWMAVAVVAFALLQVRHALGESRRNSMSAQWPSVQGTVLASSVASSSRGAGNRTHPVYFPAVSYSYQVEGRDHVGHTVRFGLLDSRDEEPARLCAGRYPAGSQVTVYFDPQEPTRSVLEPDSEEIDSGLAFGLGMLVLLGGIGWLTVHLRRRIRATQNMGSTPS